MMIRLCAESRDSLLNKPGFDNFGIKKVELLKIGLDKKKSSMWSSCPWLIKNARLEKSIEESLSKNDVDGNKEIYQIRAFQCEGC